MSFKEDILKTQKELKKIYTTEIDRIGGINIWEKLTGNEQKQETEK